jgi:hypothetical protein
MAEKLMERKKGDTRFYEVQDKVPERYAKFMPGSPTSTAYYQATCLSDGVFLYTEAGMGIIVTRELCIRQGAAGLELVECLTASGAKLLLGAVREQNNETWKNIHAALVSKMGGTVISQA